MTDTSGRKCCESLASLGLSGCLAKTFLVSTTWHSTKCFLTWSLSATPRGRLKFRLLPWTQINSDSVSGFLPTITANEGKGAGRKRWVGSKDYRGAKMSEGLRTSFNDPIYTHPNFAEGQMGYPRDWTLLETQ